MNELIGALLAIDVLARASSVVAYCIFIIFVITAIGTLACIIHTNVYYGSERLPQSLRKILKPFGIIMIPLLLIYILIPSKQTMQIALGLYATNQAVTYVADTGIAKQALSTLELKLKTIEQDLQKELEEHDSGK